MDNLIDMLRKERMIKGETKYGKLDVLNDPRSFTQECLEEVLDAISYANWAFDREEIDHVSYQKINSALQDVATMLLSGQA